MIIPTISSSHAFQLSLFGLACGRLFTAGGAPPTPHSSLICCSPALVGIVVCIGLVFGVMAWTVWTIRNKLVIEHSYLLWPPDTIYNLCDFFSKGRCLAGSRSVMASTSSPVDSCIGVSAITSTPSCGARLVMCHFPWACCWAAVPVYNFIYLNRLPH